MPRLLIGFFVAVLVHILLGAVPWPAEKQILPQPTGDESITISLTPAKYAPQHTTSHATQEREPAPTPPLVQQPVQESSPTRRTLPVPNSPKIPVAKPLPKIIKKQASKVLQAQEKNESESKQSPPPLSRNRLPAAIPTTPGHIVSGKSNTPAASPAIIKARPLYAQNPKLIYPKLARHRGWQGIVILAVTVLADGSPTQLKIQTSSGHDLLDKTALKTVKQWHFLPGTKNNVPKTMEVLVPVHFILQ